MDLTVPLCIVSYLLGLVTAGLFVRASTRAETDRISTETFERAIADESLRLLARARRIVEGALPVLSGAELRSAQLWLDGEDERPW